MKTMAEILVRVGADTGYFEDKISHYDYALRCVTELKLNGIVLNPQLEDEWIHGWEDDYIYNLAKTYSKYKEVAPDISLEDVIKLMSHGHIIN